MKIWARLICLIVCISMAVGVLSSCDIDLGDIIGDGESDAYITELEVNKKGELVVIFSDDEEENIGPFSYDGEEDGIVDISVSKKGKVTVTMSDGESETVGYTYTDENEGEDDVIEDIYISEDGELIVVRVSGDEENLGKVMDKGSGADDGECTDHVDKNKDNKCDKCGKRIEDGECTDHVDENDDKLCDKCGEKVEYPVPPDPADRYVIQMYGESGWEIFDHECDYISGKMMWEPGLAKIVYFKVKNLGDEKLFLTANLGVYSESSFTNMAGYSYYPSEFLKLAMIPNIHYEDNMFADSSEIIAAVQSYAIYANTGSFEGLAEIESNDTFYYAVVVYMPLEIGNNAQSSEPYDISFGISVEEDIELPIVCTGHKDFNRDFACDICGAPFVCPHVDANFDQACDDCGEYVPCEHHDADRNAECDRCGASVEIAWWEDITYSETTLIFQMTHCSNAEDLSSGCERYLAGEDHRGQDIDDLVAQRNDDANERTKVIVRYAYYDDVAGEYGWCKNINRIYQEVTGKSADKPDMYCNFVSDLVSASLKGSFANLYSRVRGIGDQKGVNFMDFDDPGYMGDYMRSLSLSLDKIYVIASDYFIDLIRAFYVVPVNRYLYDSIANRTIDDLNGDGVSDINDFFEEIYNGEWTYERMAQYAGAIYQNTSSVSTGMDIQDILGFCLTSNTMGAQGLIYTSSVTIIHKEWNDEKGDYDYYYPEENEEFYDFADAVRELFESEGVHYMLSSENTEPTVLQMVRKQFSTNKLLFGGVIMLGSLEYSQYQSMKEGENGGFAVVPVPVYKYGDKYLTQIHSLGRAGAISHATTKFAQCSAFIQYQSTHSEEIVQEYYLNNFACNVDGADGNVEMLNYIRQNVRTSFDMIFEDAIGFFFESTQVNSAANRWHTILARAEYKLTYLREIYINLYPTKKDNLDKLINEYSFLPD